MMEKTARSFDGREISVVEISSRSWRALARIAAEVPRGGQCSAADGRNEAMGE